MSLSALMLHARARRWLGACLAVWCWLLVLPAHASGILVLHDAAGEADGWNAARVVFDETSSLSPEAAMNRLDTGPWETVPRANLGKRRGSAWLAVSLRVPEGGRGRWVLDIDYASLDTVKLYVLDGTAIERRVALGDHLPVAERPLPSRAHAVLLDLPPGAERTLLLRVETEGSMIVPLKFYTLERYLAAESTEQALQALLAGTGLCMLLYSLAQWVTLRESMFGLYALTLGGTTAFFAALSGVGAQHVWAGSEWLVRNGPPFFILLGVCGAFGFVVRALDVARTNPRTARLMQICSAVAGIGALLYLLGLLDYRSAQGLGMALGPMPLLLLLPVAWRRVIGGDRAAAFVLAGWGVYSVGVVVIVAMLAGALPVNFWTLHGFQFASVFEMGMWMLVLGERVREVQQNAAAVRTERDLLRTIALTDMLTGLLNRRGLHESLSARLAQPDGGNPSAVFLMDLDGFKAVNDTLGHEAGDELLVAVARRLREQLRPDDLVSRLGGDEFVVAAGPLNAAADAEVIGAKLLRAFQEPFTVAGAPVRVGLTIGYAMAPHDGREVSQLLKRADAAMYAGKQAGKHCLRRALA